MVILQKVYAAPKLKTDLLFCNMNMRLARKAKRKASMSICNSNRPQPVNPARKNVKKRSL